MYNMILKIETIPQEKTGLSVKDRDHPLLAPQYNVVLLDDSEHTYEYVIEMLIQIFGHNREVSYEMALEVDTTGRVIVDTTSKERAELKRDLIQSYGADWRISGCQGSMSAVIEAAN